MLCDGLRGKSNVIISPFLLAVNVPPMLLKVISDDVLPAKVNILEVS